MSKYAVDVKPHPEALSGIGGKSQEEDRLDALIRDIGVARFASRISAGVIDESAGYETIERLVKSDVRRPLLSKLGQVLLCRPNSYDQVK